MIRARLSGSPFQGHVVTKSTEDTDLWFWGREEKGFNKQWENVRQYCTDSSLSTQVSLLFFPSTSFFSPLPEETHRLWLLEISFHFSQLAVRSLNWYKFQFKWTLANNNNNDNLSAQRIRCFTYSWIQVLKQCPQDCLSALLSSICLFPPQVVVDGHREP